ncbi:Uma2 family endonuclease [Nevskia sp.]|uniref:Uma2 family endonuclease n=1 Tax=Nevskia sp. TaxID=1929292 RepID=UPI0025DD30E7|nr:Uma2 family endonuclease [Nevskia sp.]
MKAEPIRYLTEAEYLEGEKRSEVRHEYVDGIVYAMTGATRRHNDIIVSATLQMAPAARAKRCRLNSESVKLRVGPARSYYYPDIVVSCADEPDAYFISSPCAIIEVESRETAGTDRREKRQAYLTLSSLREYVIVSQDDISAIVYRRTEDGSGWIEEALATGDLLHISCLALDVPLDALFEVF